MWSVPTKCQMILQDPDIAQPLLSVAGENMVMVNKFVYLISCLITSGHIEDKVLRSIQKHLPRMNNIQRSLKNRIYVAVVHSVSNFTDQILMGLIIIVSETNNAQCGKADLQPCWRYFVHIVSVYFQKACSL